MNPRASPIRLDNVYFANIEQASLVFFIAHAEHNLIKLKGTLMQIWKSPHIFKFI